MNKTGISKCQNVTLKTEMNGGKNYGKDCFFHDSDFTIVFFLKDIPFFLKDVPGITIIPISFKMSYPYKTAQDVYVIWILNLAIINKYIYLTNQSCG